MGLYVWVYLYASESALATCIVCRSVCMWSVCVCACVCVCVRVFVCVCECIHAVIGHLCQDARTLVLIHVLSGHAHHGQMPHYKFFT